MDFDCLVIGHGAAGLLSATRLASKGIRVAVVGRGETSTSLSTGCISLTDRIEGNDIDPDDLVSRYPYSLAGDDGTSLTSIMEDLYSFLKPELDRQGLPMRGEPFSIRRMLTSLGTPYQCSLPQLYAWKGDVERISNVETSLLGIMGHRDSDPDLASSMARSTLGLEMRPFWTMPKCFDGKADLTAGEVAQLAKRSDLVEELAEAISEVEGEMVGIPPVFDLREYQAGMESLERSSGKEVFELVSPLSLPGRRLQATMESMARAKGCTMLLGWNASSVRIEENEVEEVVITSRSREARLRISALVLATGDTLGGGLAVRGQSLSEPLMGCRCSGTGSDYRALQTDDLVRLANSGVEVDTALHPWCDGGPVANATAAGSVISGFSYASGGGIGASLLTAWLSAQTVLEVIQ